MLGLGRLFDKIWTSITTGYSSSGITRNVDGAVLERLEALLQKTPLLMTSLVELWQSEAGIDAALWLTVVTGTGVVSRTITDNHACIWLNTPAGADSASILSQQRWRAATTIAASSMPRRMVFEWECYMSSQANTGANFFMGTGPGADNRSVNNIMGFILAAAGGNFTTLTDNAGVEETTNVNPSYPGDATWGLYRIEILSGSVKFYINRVLVATHTAQLPNTYDFLNFYNISGVAVAESVLIGAVRVWFDDEPYI